MRAKNNCQRVTWPLSDDWLADCRDRWPFLRWPRNQRIKSAWYKRARQSWPKSGTHSCGTTLVLWPGHLPISLLPHMHIYATDRCSYCFSVTGFSCTIILTLFMRQHFQRKGRQTNGTIYTNNNKNTSSQVQLKKQKNNNNKKRPTKCGSFLSKRRNCANKVQHEILIPISIFIPLSA